MILDLADRAGLAVVPSVDEETWTVNGGIIRRPDGPHLVLGGGLIAALSETTAPDACLRAVIAHELGHVTRGDDRALAGSVILVGTMLAGIGASVGLTILGLGMTAWGIGLGIASLAAARWFVARARDDRHRELAADRFGADLTGDPAAAAESLMALDAYDDLMARYRAARQEVRLPELTGPALSPSEIERRIAIIDAHLAQTGRAVLRPMSRIALTPFSAHPSTAHRLGALVAGPQTS